MNGGKYCLTKGSEKKCKGSGELGARHGVEAKRDDN